MSTVSLWLSYINPSHTYSLNFFFINRKITHFRFFLKKNEIYIIYLIMSLFFCSSRDSYSGFRLFYYHYYCSITSQQIGFFFPRSIHIYTAFSYLCTDLLVYLFFYAVLGTHLVDDIMTRLDNNNKKVYESSPRIIYHMISTSETKLTQFSLFSSSFPPTFTQSIKPRSIIWDCFFFLYSV